MFISGMPVFTFVQATPATTWVISHNLGKPVIVDISSVFDGAVQKFMPYDIQMSADNNTTTIFFTLPYSGVARYTA